MRISVFFRAEAEGTLKYRERTMRLPGFAFSGSSTGICEPAGMSDQQSSPTPARTPPAPPPPPGPRGKRRPGHARLALVAASIVAAAAGGYGIARFTTYSSWHGYSGHGSAAGGAGGSSAGTGRGAGFSSPSLAQSIARQAGARLQGTAPRTVSLSRARTLGDQVPAGASVDTAAKKITFARGPVSFTVVAVPPGGPDMTFRVAGLTNPTIAVPRGAQVTVEFINADTDEAHGWLVTDQQPPFSFGQSRAPAITNAYAGLIGDPTAAGDGSRTITFQASPAGTYHYICPMPGHAQMGMHGTLIVRA
jgi:rusticyanin